MSTKKKHRGKNKKRNKSLNIQDNSMPLPDKDKNLYCGQVLKNNGNGWYRVKMKSGEYDVLERTGKRDKRARVDDYVLVESYLDKYRYLHYIYKNYDKQQDIFKTDIVKYLKGDDVVNNQDNETNNITGGYVIDVNAI